MVFHECKRCGYLTNRTSNLRKHLSNKLICEPIYSDVQRDELLEQISQSSNDQCVTCDNCGKPFKTKKTLNVHLRKCGHIIPKPNQDDKFDKVISLLEKLVEKDINSVTLVNQTFNKPYITNNNSININPQPNEFLREDYSYLTDEYILKCAHRLDNGLVEFIKAIRFNPEHPENMNIQLHVKRDKTLYVFRNDHWEICDAKWTLEEMIIHGARIIYQKFLTNSDQEKMFEDGTSESMINSWLLSILPRDNQKLLGKISKRLYAIVLDKTNLVLVEQPATLR